MKWQELVFARDRQDTSAGTTGAIEDRQAATKLYVDNSPMSQQKIYLLQNKAMIHKRIHPLVLKEED